MLYDKMAYRNNDLVVFSLSHIMLEHCSKNVGSGAEDSLEYQVLKVGKDKQEQPCGTPGSYSHT